MDSSRLSGEREFQEDSTLPMCSICHEEPPLNAIQLDCGHIFCYMCIKSAAETTGHCATCRAEIGIDFNFKEHNILGAAQIPTSTNGFYWFYEGYKGWWLYEAETNLNIEKAYQKREPTLEKFIAGYFYKIDLLNMTQQRCDGEGRSRKIKRDTLASDNIIGMAGLKGDDFKEILEMMRSMSSVT